MKRIGMFVFFVLCAYGLLQAQNYADAHWRIYEIESQLAKNGLYDEANAEFLKIFNQYDYRFAEGYSAAFANLFCNLHKTWCNDSVLITLYLQKLARSASPNLLINYCRCADSVTKNIITKQLPTYNTLFIASIDTLLLNKIDKMFENDQRVRFDNDDVHIKKVDSINLVELQSILLQYGKFPGIKELGITGMNNILSIVGHAGTYFREQWNDMLIQGVKDGDFVHTSVAAHVDDALFDGGIIIDGKWAVKYAKYGTTSYKGLCYPVKDIKKANALRREIGLPPLEYFLRENGLKHDIDEFKKHITLIEE
jgi:hypothetical protein